jgi:hypothetical protein
MAAGRLVSSEAISTRLPSRSFRRLASLAVVVVLPEPCRPTIRIGAGGLSILSAPGSSSPVRTCDQLVMDDLDDLLAGRDRFGDRLAGGLLLHRLDELARDGQRDVGLQQRHAHLAQRGATSSSDSAPCLVSRSKTPERRSERFSNMVVESVESVRVSAEVLSVDREAGQILLRNAETGEEWVHAPPGGLTGILGLEAGARVTALTTRGVTAYPAPADADPAPQVDGFTVGATREGKPAMVVGRLITQVVELVAWDPEARLATGRDASGEITIYEVRTPEGRDFLANHSAGQRFVVEISETLVLIDETG